MMAYYGPNIIILRHLFKKAFESRAILTGRRLVGREKGGEGDRADDEQRGEGGEQLQARFKPMVLQDVLVDEAQADGEDGTARGDDAVDDAHPLLEVVAEDGERGCVHQAGSGTEHDAICEVQDLHLRF